MEDIEQNKLEKSNIEIEMQFEKPTKIIEFKNIKLMIKDGVHETYANGITILHTGPTEFRLNFYDNTFANEKGDAIGIVKSIVIVPPSLIRQIIKALESNVKTYENRFGKIEDIAYSKELLNKIKKPEDI